MAIWFQFNLYNDKGSTGHGQGGSVKDWLMTAWLYGFENVTPALLALVSASVLPGLHSVRLGYLLSSLLTLRENVTLSFLPFHRVED